MLQSTHTDRQTENPMNTLSISCFHLAEIKIPNGSRQYKICSETRKLDCTTNNTESRLKLKYCDIMSTNIRVPTLLLTKKFPGLSRKVKKFFQDLLTSKQCLNIKTNTVTYCTHRVKSNAHSTS